MLDALVLEDGAAGGFIRDLPTGDGVHGGGDTIPLGERVALTIERGDLRRMGHERVAVPDVVKVADDREGDLLRRAGAEMPLEVADPEDEIGDDGGARVQFEAEELVGVDGVELLRLAEGGEGFEDLAFEALHVFERDVEEVSGAAGGIEDAGVAELAVELAGDADGFFGFAGVNEVGDGGDGVVPVGAEGLDDGGDDETLDVGARGVVRAEGGAFGLVEGAFEEGSEDGGFDVGPVGVGGFDE